MKITVFTPTYNRAYILPQLYESLKKQIYSDFEWLVIDDGSTDNTHELFDKWCESENVFEIRYFRFENCGKQREINRALGLARGELFFVVDSDDVLTHDALYKIVEWESSIENKNDYCGFAGSCGDMNGYATNPLCGERFIDATFFARYEKGEKFIGYDRPWVFYTDVHRKYMYPEFHGELFITEAVVWNRMAHDGYKIRCFDQVIYLWEHQDVGYTSNISQILLKNPKGFGLWKKELIDFLDYNYFERMKEYYSFYCDLRNDYSIKEIASFIGASKILICFLAIIFKIKHGVN